MFRFLRYQSFSSMIVVFILVLMTSCGRTQANQPPSVQTNNLHEPKPAKPEPPPTNPEGPIPQLPPPSKEQLDFARNLSRTFTQAASQISPSVVSIQVEGRKKLAPSQRNALRGLPFLFGYGDEDINQDTQFQAAGSGFVIDERGYIVTNRHVIQDADLIEVTFVDGKTVRAKIVGADPRLDVAVIKVERPRGYQLKAAKLGDSSRLETGEWVMAIGNNLGLDHTVTVGVVSATSRTLRGIADGHGIIQTDASINSGNSGGPLINLDGEVIGINTLIYSPYGTAGGNVGVGFAIPSNLIKPSITELIATGKVVRAYIGISIQMLTEKDQDILENLLGIHGKGTTIVDVSPDSPAEKAGILPGDILLSIDGKPITNHAEVPRMIASHKVGDVLHLEILRKWKKTPVKISVQTEELPQSRIDVDDAPHPRRRMLP